MEYFREVSGHAESGELSGSSESKIESECVDLRKIEIHLGSDTAKVLSEMEECDLRTTVEGLPELMNLLHQTDLCITARLCGCRIMVFASDDPNWLHDRLKRIRNDYRESFVANSELAFEMVEESLLLSSRAGQSFWSDLEAVEKILASLQDLMPPSRFEGAIESFEEEAAMTRNAIVQRKSPQPMLLKVSDGKIEGFSVAANLNRQAA